MSLIICYKYVHVVNYNLCIYLKREIQYKNIYSMYNRARQSRSPEQTRQVLYTTVVLFLECLYTYVSSVDPQSFLGPSASHTPLVLMEKFENESADEEPQWVLKWILNLSCHFLYLIEKFQISITCKFKLMQENFSSCSLGIVEL